MLLPFVTKTLLLFYHTLRMLSRANYGTNGGSALTRLATVPTRSDTVLVTETKYDIATGRAFRTIRPVRKR